MGRLILLALLVLAAVWLIRRALREREPPPGPPGKPGELVACAHCGVHLPAGEARRADGTPYCSDEHARLGPRRP